MKAGRAYVPLDPEHPAERRAFLLADSEAAYVITSLDDAIAESVPDAFVAPDSAAYVMYTSGSTGTPKGVIGLHGAAVNRLRWMWRAFPFAADDVCCQKTTITFVDSVWEIFGPLLAGVPSMVLDAATASDPARLARAIADGHVTRLVLVPSLLRELLRLDDAAALLRSLTTVVSSGEALPVELAARFAELLPHCRLLNLYGSTEVAADVTAHVVESVEDASIAIGQPIDGVSVRILDAHLQPVAPGVFGELYVAGANNARGYWRRPALTAERWIADPYGPPGTRLFRTGDLARVRADGALELRGRADRQLKIRGVRIEPAEIQSALAAFPGVRESVVVSRIHAGESHLAAYVSGEALNEADLRAFLRARLPAAMVPSAFVVLHELPLNTSGKIDVRALPPVSGEASPERALTAAEEIVAAIWRDVLDVEQLAPSANFFQLGGHSLAAIRVVGRINEAFGCDLPASLLFDSSTLEELARAAANAAPHFDDARIVPAGPMENAPASATQRRAWFLQQLEKGATVDNLVLACRLRGALDVDALERALRAIVERHAVLRTRLVEIDGELRQVVAGGTEFSVERIGVARATLPPPAGGTPARSAGGTPAFHHAPEQHELSMWLEHEAQRAVRPGRGSADARGHRRAKRWSAAVPPAERSGAAAQWSAGVPPAERAGVPPAGGGSVARTRRAKFSAAEAPRTRIPGQRTRAADHAASRRLRRLVGDDPHAGAQPPLSRRNEPSHHCRSHTRTTRPGRSGSAAPTTFDGNSTRGARSWPVRRCCSTCRSIIPVPTCRPGARDARRSPSTPRSSNGCARSRGRTTPRCS